MPANLNNRSRSIQKKQRFREQQRFFEQFKSKPFWIWDKDLHKRQHALFSGRCCFNHMIGLPVKNSKKMPLFDYEQEILDSLQDTKYLWIKKATGLGITEFMLRYIAWLCLRDDKLKGSHICIVTGPRIDLAITLVERIKGLFPTMTFDTRETVVLLNEVKIEAFPSHHLDAMRGLPNVSFILLDEADFFPIGQQQDARNVSERYIAKSNPYIVMISTPNRPFGLFEQIEKEKKSIYHRIFLPYTVGLNKIYTIEEIEAAKQSPSFEREYNLSYIAGLEGDAFHERDIQKAIELGKLLGDPTTLDNNAILRRGNSRLRETRVLAADPGFGSSSYGLCVLGLSNGCIQILYADELGPRPDFNNAISKTLYLYDFYECKCILVDAANSAVISALKRELGERTDYLSHIAQLKAGWHVDNNDITGLKRHMRVIPVSFGAGESKNMLTTAQVYLSQGGVAIHPKFDKLIMALRTATILVVGTDGTLDKELTQFDDTFDAFRMALRFFKSEKR